MCAQHTNGQQYSRNALTETGLEIFNCERDMDYKLLSMSLFKDPLKSGSSNHVDTPQESNE